MRYRRIGTTAMVVAIAVLAAGCQSSGTTEDEPPVPRQSQLVLK